VQQKGTRRQLLRGAGVCGLLDKVVGDETEPVKKCVRQFCSAVRSQVKGRPLPEEFPWR